MNFERLDEGKDVKKGVLASYKATFMEFNKVNENNRLYPSEIGKNRVLNEKTMQEIKINKLLGEINHPKDRFDIDYEKVAINTTSLYYDEPSDSIKGTFDILDTPMGRILKTLVDYGTHISLSARAMGKTKDVKGVQQIIEESYMFKTFDAVVDPGFSVATIDPSKDAINESLKSVYTSLNDDEKSQVNPLLESIGMPKDFLYTNEGCQDNDDNDNDSDSVSEDKSDMQNLIDEYQSIIDILKSQIEDKENKISDITNEYKSVIDVLNTSNTLNEEKYIEQLGNYKDVVNTLTKALKSTEAKLQDSQVKLQESVQYYNTLLDKVNEYKDELKSTRDDLVTLSEANSTLDINAKNSIDSLDRDLQKSKSDFINLQESYDELLAKYNELLNKDSFKVNESFISDSNNFTLVNVISESKDIAKASPDALTTNLLNKIKK